MPTLRLWLFCLTAVFLAGCGEPDIRSKASAGDPAEAGDTSAPTASGLMYWLINAKGEDKPTDAKWVRKAADQGYADAQNKLGYIYAKGEGVPKDAAEAVKWYRKAADQGYAKAQTNLGYMYANGEGVPKDAAEAYTWFNLASISDDYSRKSRDELEKSLTPEQKVRAQQRSTELHKEIEARKKAAGK